MPRVTLLHREGRGLGLHIQQNSAGLVVFGSPAVRPEWFKIPGLSQMEIEIRGRLRDNERIQSVNNISVQSMADLFSLIPKLIEEQKQLIGGAATTVALDFEFGGSVASVAVPPADIESVSEYIKVVCPVSHNRVENAVRGNNCTHNTFFDQESFTTMMKSTKKNELKCPICCNE